MSDISVQNLTFIDNACTTAEPARYIEIIVNAQSVLESWRLSIYSFEWMDSEGILRDKGELSERDRTRREEVEANIKSQTPLEKPVLGLGLQDNVEIGSGKALFMTLAAHGLSTIPVQILKSNESDFKAYRVDV